MELTNHEKIRLLEIAVDIAKHNSLVAQGTKDALAETSYLKIYKDIIKLLKDK